MRSSTLVPAVMLSLVLAACGDDGSNDPSNTGTASTGKPTTTGGSGTTAGAMTTGGKGTGTTSGTGSGSATAGSSTTRSGSSGSGSDTDTGTTGGKGSSGTDATDTAGADTTSSTDTSDTTGGATDPGGGDALSFAKDIYPILVENCGCHAEGSGKAGLSIPKNDASTALANLLMNSTQAPTLKRVAPGEPTKSYLLAKLSGVMIASGDQMPKGKAPLDPTTLKLFVDWITDGAKP